MTVPELDNSEAKIEILRLRVENTTLQRQMALLKPDGTGCRKQDLEQLRTQLRTREAALVHTPDFTYLFDLKGRFTYVNRALLSLWQKSLEQAVGKDFFELDYTPLLAGRLQQRIQQVITSRERLRDETPYTGANGVTGFYEYIFVPVLAADGSVEAVAGSTRDITDRKRAETALRESEERFSTTFADAPVAMALTTAEGEFVHPIRPVWTCLATTRRIW